MISQDKLHAVTSITEAMIQKQLVLLALFLPAVLFHTRVEAVALDTETINNYNLKTKEIEKTQPDETIATVPEDNVVDELQLLSSNKPLPTPGSCKEIKNKNPQSKSGMYNFKVEGKTVGAYCNMDTLCDSDDGWTRIAYLNMDDLRVSCPSSLQERNAGKTIRGCGRKTANTGTCNSVFYSSLGIRYSQICGRVYGYQYGTPDAVHNEKSSVQYNINAPYVDGVSVTRGSPREHIWSFLGSISEYSGKLSDSSCPCAKGSKQYIQLFIGSNYFCESGNPLSNLYSFVFYTGDKLWDGKGCNNDEMNCCTAYGRPWFYRKLSVRSDDIEVRVCGDQDPNDEDALINYIEIYVK